MAGSKKNNKLLAPILVAIMLAILALAGLVLLFNKQQKPTNIVNESSTLTEEKVQATPNVVGTLVSERGEESIKDGVYTNNTFGFRFKYDNNVFPKQVESQSYSMSFVSQESDYLPKLTVSMPNGDKNNLKEIVRKAYNRCREYKTTETFRDGLLVSGTGTKIFENGIGCAFRFDPEGAIDVEPGWGYASLFDIKGQTVSIGLSVWNQEQLAQFEVLFRDIFNSVELLN